MSLTVEPRTIDAVINKPFAVPRKHLRFALAAEAEVTALTNGLHLEAGVSELSACGCYLDTPTPFSAGTEVRLRIRRAGDSCELPGKVIYVHKGWGMGILFGHAATEQSRVLDKWLAEFELYGSLARSNLFLG
jgi:hypothetical protein